MAQRVHTVLISDLSGDEVEDGLESVSFGYRGVDYVIDLTAKEAAGFDKAIAMYVEHARKAPRRTSVSGAKSSGSYGSSRSPGSPGSSGSSGASRTSDHAHAARIGNVKKWAADQGLDYPQRGRLPKSLLDAYDAAH
jgi:hypothetical protein